MSAKVSSSASVSNISVKWEVKSALVWMMEYWLPRLSAKERKVVMDCICSNSEVAVSIP